ncbi:diadenylate cyclase CdaA [bacterium]|nr:diadenylate cyclase CdaA [bacterium]
MMNDILNYLTKQLISTFSRLSWVNALEILIIVGILWVVYRRFIKGTQSENIVKGSFILVFVWIFSEVLQIFQLNILGMFLKSIVIIVSLSLIVIFQPELRKILGYFGQMDFFHGTFSVMNEKEEINVIKEIIETVKYLSKSHTGALMVFQKDLSNTYTNVGTILNADLSMELLLTIFHINTPLHDGAVVINGKKIISAGVLLPLTEDPKLSWKYGTRHRAAIGMSEQSDAICLVVSEETGDISIAIDGILKKYDDVQNLQSDLENLLTDKTLKNTITDKKMFNFNNLLQKSDKE